MFEHVYKKNPRRKRPGRHTKNPNKKNTKKKYRGQGRV